MLTHTFYFCDKDKDNNNGKLDTCIHDKDSKGRSQQKTMTAEVPRIFWHSRKYNVLRQSLLKPS